MPRQFDSVVDFQESLAEVTLLLTIAQDREGDQAIQSALTKAALLLLMGKFENFAECLAEEAVFRINNASLPVERIPVRLKLIHSAHAISDVAYIRKVERQEQSSAILQSLASLWSPNGKGMALEIPCRFSYGKHGEDELRKLFDPFGILDVFDAVEIRDTTETLADTPTAGVVDFRGVFNGTTNIRNNILHQDATPELTVEQVATYRDLFANFADGLGHVLRETLDLPEAVG